MEIIGTILLTITAAVNNVAGIGGGGMMIPLTIAFFMMRTKEAIAVQSFAIIINSFARFLQTLKDKHPEKDSCIIDYNLATIMMPTLLIGSFVGAFFNVILPSLISYSFSFLPLINYIFINKKQNK